MKIEIIKADITNLTVDAIVNAANTSLLGGGGVDGAIHKKGGKAILNACMDIRNKQGGCKTGEAVITTAGNLPCKYVIHTVGPVWNGGQKNEIKLLKNCYTNCLNIAIGNNIKSIAFPGISTGIYKFPKDNACEIAINSIATFKNINYFDTVFFVCFDDESYELYTNNLTQWTKKI